MRRRYLRSLLPRSSGHLNACPAYYYTYNTQIRLKSSKTDPGVNSWRGTKLIQLGIHIKGVTPEKFSPLPSLTWLLAFMESFLTWLVCLRSFSLGENKTNYMVDKPGELLRKIMLKSMRESNLYLQGTYD